MYAIRSYYACPEIKIAGLLLTPISTVVISGFPYFDVFASSSSAIAETPNCPVSKVSATRSSTERESSNKEARALYKIV